MKAQQLMSTEDAARILGVTSEWMRKLEARGEITAQRTLSGRRVFFGDEVERFRKSREQKKAAK